MRRKPVYIRGAGVISPQQTYDPEVFLPQVSEYTDEFLPCIQPDYKQYINPIAARRMSRLIKMGITAAKIALHDAKMLPSPSAEETHAASLPDAIITGTGLGSVEDTERILNAMNAGEVLMNPTPFIQSTYNTISSQIAITLNCHHYNSTYVHRSFSFESALEDAIMQLSEGEASTALVGGIDEMTLNHLTITRRAGHWKMIPVHNLNLLACKTPGALAGEGAAFFILAASDSGEPYASLRDVHTSYKPSGPSQPETEILAFLASNGLNPDQVDAVILGYNGDMDHDPVYDRVGSVIFRQNQQLWYKHLCGEYYTSTGFALWLAANILKHQRIPSVVKMNDLNPDRLLNILIYNQYRNINHSMFLLSR